MIAALALAAEKICAEWGIGRFAFYEEPGIFNFDLFDKANSERLAELAGEPVGIQALASLGECARQFKDVGLT